MRERKELNSEDVTLSCVNCWMDDTYEQREIHADAFGLHTRCHNCGVMIEV